MTRGRSPAAAAGAAGARAARHRRDRARPPALRSRGRARRLLGRRDPLPRRRMGRRARQRRRRLLRPDFGGRPPLAPRPRRAALCAGLRMIDTPGHTAGHRSLVIELAEGPPVILAGDAADLHENLEREIAPGILWRTATGERGPGARQHPPPQGAGRATPGAELWPNHDLAHWRRLVARGWPTLAARPSASAPERCDPVRGPKAAGSSARASARVRPRPDVARPEAPGLFRLPARARTSSTVVSVPQMPPSSSIIFSQARRISGSKQEMASAT